MFRRRRRERDHLHNIARLEIDLEMREPTREELAEAHKRWLRERGDTWGKPEPQGPAVAQYL